MSLISTVVAIGELQDITFERRSIEELPHHLFHVCISRILLIEWNLVAFDYGRQNMLLWNYLELGYVVITTSSSTPPSYSAQKLSSTTTSPRANCPPAKGFFLRPSMPGQTKPLLIFGWAFQPSTVLSSLNILGNAMLLFGFIGYSLLSSHSGPQRSGEFILASQVSSAANAT